MVRLVRTNEVEDNPQPNGLSSSRINQHRGSTSLYKWPQIRGDEDRLFDPDDHDPQSWWHDQR